MPRRSGKVGAVTHPFLTGPWPRAFAHRGWHTGELAGMENSLSAFRAAVAAGYRYIETDVHATMDGVVVIQHDPVLDRTTDRPGVIRELPWSEVGAAMVGGREPIPRLEHALEEFPETFFNIDVKADSAVPAVLRTLRRLNAWDRVCLAAFDDSRLHALRRAGDQRLLTSMGQRSAAALWLGSRLTSWPVRPLVRGCAAQVPPIHGQIRVVDHRLLRLAHRWGLEVHVWTVDEPAEMARLLDLGVDGLVTDRPDLLREVLRSRGEWVEAPSALTTD